jgi:isoquinoline 1-oxidoreductase beta subunit
VAQTLGLDVSKVIVHKCHLGGGFGRRGLSQDWARQAVLIARAVGLPVKMIWTREEDMRHDFYRPMVVARQTAGFDSDGRLSAGRYACAARRSSPAWRRISCATARTSR